MKPEALESAMDSRVLQAVDPVVPRAPQTPAGSSGTTIFGRIRAPGPDVPTGVRGMGNLCSSGCTRAIPAVTSYHAAKNPCQIAVGKAALQSLFAGPATECFLSAQEIDGNVS